MKKLIQHTYFYIVFIILFLSCSQKLKYRKLHESVCENGFDYYGFKLLKFDTSSYKLVVINKSSGSILEKYEPKMISIKSNKIPSIETLKSNIISQTYLNEHKINDTLDLRMIMILPIKYDEQKISFPITFKCKDTVGILEGLPVKFNDRYLIPIPK